jgi:hypothetical protein
MILNRETIIATGVGLCYRTAAIGVPSVPVVSVDPSGVDFSERHRAASYGWSFYLLSPVTVTDLAWDAWEWAQIERRRGVP